MMRKLMCFLVVALFVGISVSVDAAMLCSNPSGSVFVREQCKKNEQQLNPIELGLVGSIYVVQSPLVTTEIGDYGTATAACDAGDRVLGGGHLTGASHIYVGRSWPDTDSSWTVSIAPIDVAIGWYAYAVCLKTN